MYTLGIETSCDETSAAVLKGAAGLLSNEVSSSLSLHKRYGGVIPEIASRKQLETITAVTDAALKDAGVRREQIGLISVTSRPGLIGSLLVGVTFAKTLSMALDVPLVGVDHVRAHLCANFLAHKNIAFPFVALVVSGGHTSLFYASDFARIDELGRTHDDACGEAFDKVARMMGMGYPGGPLVEAAARAGNPRAVAFSCSGTKNEFDFSFSGIKTAVFYYLRKRGYVDNGGKIRKSIPVKVKADICASFQEAAFDAITQKSLAACLSKKSKKILVGGGVALNIRLRQKFQEVVGSRGIDCYFPPRDLCMDNAGMIAVYGYQLYKKGYRSHAGLVPQ